MNKKASNPPPARRSEPALHEIGATYLVTTHSWFIAPDGCQYKAAWGTVHSIDTDDMLGIKTNRHSSNWYLKIGNMVIAGCQIHYAVKAPECSFTPVEREVEHEGDLRSVMETQSRIYNADELSS